jgi:probable HAF family extracellular repeat protein
MKSEKLLCITAMALVVTLAIPVSLAAQEHPTKHHKYNLVDIGTFGGPGSHINGPQFINNRGMFAGYADTSTPDPFNPGGFITHTFRWHDGVLTDLGAIADGSNCNTINDRGWISGGSQNGLIDPLTGGPQQVAALWEGDQLINLGTLEGGYQADATDVNDSGQVVGFAGNLVSDPFFGTQVRQFFWENGVMTDVGTLGGPDSPPFGNPSINESGQVAGSSFLNSIPNPATGIPTTDPFLWTKDGGMQDLGTLGGTVGLPLSMNNRGQVAGDSNMPGDLTFHPFLWDKKNGIIDVGTLGGDNGTVDHINEAGDVVGKADLPGSQLHDGFLWRNGKMTDLGTLAGDPCTRANWINAQRQIVGNSSDCRIPLRAILWEDGGPPIDLNTLIPPNSSLQLVNAYDINDQGEIAGLGVPAGCQPADVDTCGHAYLLIPYGHGHADRAAYGDNRGNSAPVTQRPTVMTPHSPVSNQRVAPFRIPLIRGYRGGA